MKFLIAAVVLISSQLAFAKACKVTQDLSKYGQGIIVTCDETKNYPQEWFEKLCRPGQIPGVKMERLNSCPTNAYATCTTTAEQSNKALADLAKMPGAKVKGQMPAGGILIRYHYTKANLEQDKRFCTYGTWKLK